MCKIRLIQGRSSCCDLKIPDVSISREHALLFISNGCLYIDDTLSRYGTSIQLMGDLIIIPNYRVGLIIRRWLTIFHVVRTWLSYLLCYRF